MIRSRPLLILALLLTAASVAAPVRADDTQKKKGGGVTFVQLRTLTATVLRADGRRGVMTIEVGVDIPNAGLRSRADISKPLLQAAYVQMLQVYASGLGPGAVPDADYIERMLQRQTDTVLKAPGGRLLLGTILVN